MRSLLFVPADSERKLERALAGEADALLIDLEDSVAPGAKAAARRTAAAALAAPRRMRLIVRINGLETGLAEADLAAILRAAPDGVMLPKCRNGGDVLRLVAMMRASGGAVPVLPIATESAESIFGLGTYREASAHLIGLTWGGEDLAADLGAEGNRDAAGRYREPFRLARNLALFAAAAAGAEPIDSIFPAFRDSAGLRAEAEEARRDGFTGKLAIHPDQVPVINAIFTPSAEALARARAVVQLFAERPDAGALQLDGEMVDRPHLVQAERLLRRAADAPH